MKKNDINLYKNELKNILTPEEYILLEAHINGTSIDDAIRGTGIHKRTITLQWICIGKKLMYYDIIGSLIEPVMASEEYRRGWNDFRSQVFGQLNYTLTQAKMEKGLYGKNKKFNNRQKSKKRKN